MIYDEKDKVILRALQAKGRMTAKDVASKVGLSIPAVTERIRKLVERGYIRAFRAIMEPKKIGYDVTAFILVVMESSKHYEDMVSRAKKNENVLECHSITGEGSHILKVRSHNTSTLEQLLREVQSWPGVSHTHTMIVMSSYKDDTQLPLI